MNIIENKKKNDFYVAEIDGLRALAIIAVILNHLNINLLQSGFLGVDIFFVISGYVITKSVLRSQFINFFEFIKSFFQKRFKRLFPALFVYVIFISFILCLFNPFPNVSIRTGFFSLLGLSNFYLFKYSTDYFAQASYLNPFVNTWSLGIEEQFYLIFPVIIFFSRFFNKKKNRNYILVQLVSILSVISLFLFLKYYYLKPSFAYFLIITRFWEIGFGVLIYIFNKENKVKLTEKLLNKLNFSQLFGIIILALLLNSVNQSNQIKTLFVVLITSFFLISFNKESLINKILSNKVLVYIGRISYSLYLWHWGIISLSYWIYGDNSNPLFLLIIIFFISYLSFKYIENPLRKMQWKIYFFRTYQIILIMVTFSFFFIYFLGEARQTRYKLISLVTGNNIEPESFYLSQNVSGTTINRQNCHGSKILNYASFSEVIEKCSHDYSKDNKKKSRRIFLAGDSHSYALRNLIANLANKYQTSFTSVSGSMFPSDDHWYKSNTKLYTSDLLIKITKDYKKYILNNANKDDIVVIANRIVTVYSDPVNKLQKKLYDQALFFDSNGQSISRDKSLDFWFNDLELFVSEAKKRNLLIIYVAPVPEFELSAQACLFSANRNNCSQIDKNLLLKKYKNIYGYLKIISEKYNNFTLVDPFKELCNDRKCFMSGTSFDNRKIVSFYNDNNHLSLTGSSKLFNQFDEIVKELIIYDIDQLDFIPSFDNKKIKF